MEGAVVVLEVRREFGGVGRVEVDYRTVGVESLEGVSVDADM